MALIGHDYWVDVGLKDSVESAVKRAKRRKDRTGICQEGEGEREESREEEESRPYGGDINWLAAHTEKHPGRELGRSDWRVGWAHKSNDQAHQWEDTRGSIREAPSSGQARGDRALVVWIPLWVSTPGGAWFACEPSCPAVWFLLCSGILLWTRHSRVSKLHKTSPKHSATNHWIFKLKQLSNWSVFKSFLTLKHMILPPNQYS